MFDIGPACDATTRRALLIREAMTAIAGQVDEEVAYEIARHAVEPSVMATLIQHHLNLSADQVIIAGTFDNRQLFLHSQGRAWILLNTSGKPVGTVDWPNALAPELHIADASGYLSRVELSYAAVHRLTRPKVMLIALYHPEVFPLPRFPLGISDLARAIRHGLTGHVRLEDMQLTQSLDAILHAIDEYLPDILGISATFGQYDILTALADQLESRASTPPLVVFGGSLAALNRESLLESYPNSIVALGPGELTMRDVVAAWHGDIEMHQIRGIAYHGPKVVTMSRRIDNRTYDGVLPELDLLRPTLERHGVMQLESSRGCTHACSFCPRKHKGIWSGDDPDNIAGIVPELADIYAEYPNTSRRIYLVDEEFLGHDQGGQETQRADAVARSIHAAGFRWETNSRIDQVYRSDRDKNWHVRRMELWTRLHEQGLDRCLFGVESGVDSILRRFNKRTTAHQNAMAIRILSACDIPIRCTYITFDHLMNLSELIATYQFQGRTDLLLNPVSDVPFDELYDLIHDEAFVRAQASGKPFYSSISYMLVTMECLLNSPYLKLVEAEGLAEGVLPSMGRRNACFRESSIGAVSQWAQRWIDRNFSFDYTLKSLEKITEGIEKGGLRQLRLLLKRSAYELLGRMIALVVDSRGRDPSGDELTTILSSDVASHFDELRASIAARLPEVLHVLRPERRAILRREYGRWSMRDSWGLINSPDQCL